MRSLINWPIGASALIYTNGCHYTASFRHGQWMLIYGGANPYSEEAAIEEIKLGCLWLLNNPQEWEYKQFKNDIWAVIAELFGPELIKLDSKPVYRVTGWASDILDQPYRLLKSELTLVGVFPTSLLFETENKESLSAGFNDVSLERLNSSTKPNEID